MNKKVRNILLALVAILVVGSCVFMFSISPLEPRQGNREMPEATNKTDELTEGLVVEQSFENYTDNIKEIAIVFTRLYYLEEADANHTLAIELLDGNQVLASQIIKSNDIPDQHRVYIEIDNPISGYVGKELILKVYENSKCDTGVALMVCDDANGSYTFDGNKKQGSICFSLTGE